MLLFCYNTRPDLLTTITIKQNTVLLITITFVKSRLFLKTVGLTEPSLTVVKLTEFKVSINATE